MLLSDNELLSLQNKKGMNRSAAVQFVRKDWGKFTLIISCTMIPSGVLIGNIKADNCKVTNINKGATEETCRRVEVG